MKKIIVSMTVFVLGTAGLSFGQKEIKLTSTGDEVIVNVTPEKAWEVINSYGDVGAYHSGIIHSKSINNSKNEGYLNCERQCTIENGRKDIIVDEKIVEYVEGQYYKYDVTRTENFPVKKFYNTFGVKTNAENQTVIYVKSEFRLDPGFLTGFAKGKLRRGNHDVLIAYKHYMETGERNADPKELKKKYKDS
jgi:hypothetical protein